MVGPRRRSRSARRRRRRPRRRRRSFTPDPHPARVYLSAAARDAPGADDELSSRCHLHVIVGRLDSRAGGRCGSWSSRTRRGSSRSSRGASRPRGTRSTRPATDGTGLDLRDARHAGTWSSSTSCCPGSNGLEVLARAAAREARAAGPDPLRPRATCRRSSAASSSAPRLHREAVLARRAARARSACSCAARPPIGDEHVLRGGSVVLDLARRQARVDERVCDLSDREFRLLHHLLLHAGEVISRERLLADVWGYDFDPGLERRRRLRAPPAQEARAGRPDRDGAACGLSPGCGVTRSSSRGRRSRPRTSSRWSLWPSWETIPFHFVWISLTLVYGFRVWTRADDGARDPRP